MAKGMQWDVKTANLLDKKILRYFFEKFGAMNIDNPLIYDDATFKGSVAIEGGLDLIEAKDFDIAGDQTVKGDLHIEGRTFITELRDIPIFRDNVLFYEDATVKGDIYIGAVGNNHRLHDEAGWFMIESGDSMRIVAETLEISPYAGPTRILRDILINRDATVKQDFVVEDQETSYRGITTDLTACGVKYRIVKGLIVEATQKAWA